MLVKTGKPHPHFDIIARYILFIQQKCWFLQLLKDVSMFGIMLMVFMSYLFLYCTRRRCLQIEHRVDIDRGSVHWVQQASWAELYNFKNIGFVCLYTSHCSSASFFVCLHLNMIYYDLNICKNRSLKQTPADPAVCVLYEPLQTLQYVYCMNPWKPCSMCTVWTTLPLGIGFSCDKLAKCLYLSMR